VTLDNGTDGQTDRRTDRQTDRRTDRVRRNMRPPPREEGRIKKTSLYATYNSDMTHRKQKLEGWMVDERQFETDMRPPAKQMRNSLIDGHPRRA